MRFAVIVVVHVVILVVLPVVVGGLVVVVHVCFHVFVFLVKNGFSGSGGFGCGVRVNKIGGNSERRLSPGAGNLFGFTGRSSACVEFNGGLHGLHAGVTPGIFLGQAGGNIFVLVCVHRFTLGEVFNKRVSGNHISDR